MLNRNIRLFEMIVSVNLGGINYREIQYYLHKYWYIDDNRPRPVFDLIFILAYGGYPFIFFLLYVSAISYSMPKGIYLKFFYSSACLIYSLSALILILRKTNEFTITTTALSAFFVLILLLDLVEQFDEPFMKMQTLKKYHKRNKAVPVEQQQPEPEGSIEEEADEEE